MKGVFSLADSFLYRPSKKIKIVHFNSINGLILLVSSYLFGLPIDNSVYETINTDMNIVSGDQQRSTGERIPIDTFTVNQIKRNCTNYAGQEDVFWIDAENDLSIFSGQNYTINNISEIQDILHTFQLHRTSDGILPDYQPINDIAEEWYQKNQHINYVPLKVTLIKYKRLELNTQNNTAFLSDNKYFVSVAPHVDHRSSQIVTLGFENGFFLTNTGYSVSHLTLHVNGENINLNPGGSIPVGLNGGNSVITIDVHFTNNLSFKSAITFNVDRFQDSSWLNSHVNTNGRLAFSNTTSGVTHSFFYPKVLIEGKSYDLTVCHIRKVVQTGSAQVKKPLVFVEGFDQNHGTANAFSIDSMIVMLMSTGLYNYFTSKGYDIFLVNLNYNWDDIKRQAYSLGVAFQNIWDSSNKIEPIKVVGFSMGGIVSTVACGIKKFRATSNLYQETWEQGLLNTWNFKANLCLTWDSPHSGAYMPSSIIEFCKFWGSFNKIADQGYKALISKSSTQQLFFTRIPGDGANLITRIEFNNFYKSLLNSFKSDNTLKFTSIVNGSWNGVTQKTDYYGQMFSASKIYWKDNCKIWADTRVSDNGTTNSGEIFYGHLVASWQNLFVAKEKTLTVSGRSLFPGNIPGGYRNTFGICANALQAKGFDVYIRNQLHAFIPTFSAVGLDSATFVDQNKWNLSAVEASSGPLVNGSPFDRIYHHDGPNQEHVREFNQENLSWLKKEITYATISNSIAPIINLLLND